MSNITTNAETVLMDSLVTCENSEGVEIHARLVRLGRYDVAFEIDSAATLVRMSEVLTSFRVVVRDRPIYSGRAVVKSLVNAGSILVCQADLDDSWLEVDLFRQILEPQQLRGSFETLVGSWGKTYRILPEYKLAVADIQSFLFDLRHWTEQIELGLASLPKSGQQETVQQVVQELIQPVTPCLNTLFEKFELAAANISEDRKAAHAVYAKRQLHPLVMSSPFMHRIFRKPLGYPGDYEMVNMILRNPIEGSSVFAKVLNAWFLSQGPAEAHRNRIKYLTRRFIEESASARARNGGLKIFNLGCGPAREVANFMAESELSHSAEFTLLDFNDETLTYTNGALSKARAQHSRRTKIEFQKKSVAQVLKASRRAPDSRYDVIYCAGLFDYLSDRICKQLMNSFHDMLAPGGLLVATNVDVFNPIKSIMGYIFEWHLIYRDAQQMAALAPDGAAPDDCKVSADMTGSNIFLEVRKPRPNP
ncbi:MAG TPA: class I SAM-dependent methyltransferase [Verrucomicrobiae bacterium]